MSVVNFGGFSRSTFGFFFSNNIVPCESLPAVDLSLWKDLRGTGEHLGYYKK